MLVVQTVQMLGGADDICADSVGARTVLVLCKPCLEVKMLGVQTVQMLGGGDDICADAVGAVQTLFGGQDVGGADDTCADGVGAGPFWWCNFNIGDADPICRVGQDPICTPYMTVCMVMFLPKIPYIHCTYICMVWANPINERIHKMQSALRK